MGRSKIATTPFEAVMKWCLENGHGKLSKRMSAPVAYKLPVFEHDGSEWEVWVNASNEPCEQDAVTIPPWTAYVEFNGWPAGFLDPSGGEFAAGSYGNVDRFLAALKAWPGGVT